MSEKIDDGFRSGGGLQDLKGSVPPKRHKLHRNNVEQEENETMMEKRLRGEKQLFPMHVHKVGGLVRPVENEAQLEDALAKGWKQDIRDVEELEPKEAPTKASEMTVKQALAFIAEHKDDAQALIDIEADEASHGNRAPVIAALNDAKDNFGASRAPKAPAAPKGKAKTAPKKK